MPTLSYTSSDFPFQPFAKIYSADVNQCFTDISTLLNTTKLDSTNVQVHGLTRLGSSSNLAAGTVGALMVNDGSGNMSELVLGSPGQVVQVNGAGTGFSVGSTPNPATLNIFNTQNFV